MKFDEMFNKYSGLSGIKRTGWVRRNIAQPESVADHVYSCCEIAFCMLPKTLPEEEMGAEYDRGSIMDLLLIHDMGEVEIGDKVRGSKTDDDKRREFLSVHEFLSVTKGENPDAVDYDRLEELWCDMESGDPQNINARIAKEIDYIQGAYRYFLYCINGKVDFNEKSCNEWLNEVSDEKIRTPIGKRIRERLILKNSAFLNHKVLGEYFK